LEQKKKKCHFHPITNYVRSRREGRVVLKREKGRFEMGETTEVLEGGKRRNIVFSRNL